MEKFKIFLNQNKIQSKESIKNILRIKNNDKGNLSITKYDINKSKSKNKLKQKELNQNSNKFTDISDKLFIKSFNKDNALEELIKNNNTKKSYSIKLKQNFNTNNNSNANNSLNFHIYNFSLKNKHHYIQNKNNQTIDVNTSSELKKINLNENNLFLSFNNNNKINKENEQNKYFRTLENNSKETINSNHNNNYINNIINININFDKKKKRYKQFLSSSLKETINYFTDNLFHKDKNIKLNFKFDKNNLNTNISSSMKSIKTNKKNFDIQYNHTISNEMQNNNRVRSKNTFLKLLLKNKNKKSNKYISFGKILSASENKRIYNFNENNLKTMKNNILLKVKNNNNIHKLLLLNNINPIINQNNKAQRTKKKKNYFIQNKKSNEINKIKYFNPSKENVNNNKFINLIHSPKETEIKLFLKNTNKKDNIFYYNNNKPELVKEYNQEILLNLLIDEYLFHKNNKLILNSEILINYGLNPILRLYFIDSLLGLQETFRFHNKTLFITLQIFDNYITKIISNKIKVKETQLDLIFTSCFLIASKSEESFIYHIKDYLSIISETYTINDLMSMEYNILKLFDFTAFIPNVLDFFEFFSVLYDLDENMIKKGVIILLIILCELNLSQLNSSFLAFSVICLLCGKKINYNDMFKKLDNIYYNLNKDNNINNNNDVYNKFIMILKPLKNIDEIKKTVEIINKYIRNFKNEELKNVEKKVKELLII